MKTKLTLSVDADLIQFARHEAKADSTSVSGLFSDFLRQRQTQALVDEVKTVAEMVGSLKQYTIDDSKEGIRAAYAKKYLNRP